MRLIESIFEKGNNENPFLCAEMSGNHKGSLETALEFVRDAKKYGADFIKLQVYTADTITLNNNSSDFQIKIDNEWSQYETLYSLYSKAYTPWKWVELMFKEAKKIGIEIFASPFDISALTFLEKLNCPVYKIASPEITDHNLIRECAKTGKPVILSTGLSSEDDLDSAVKILIEEKVKFMILKCVSAYPTELKDLNLSVIPKLKNKYNCNIGFSDHTIGSEASMAAIALGATLIEKHFKLTGDNSSIDSSFSMELSDLPLFKKNINDIYISLGKPLLELSDSAKESFFARRSLYVSEDIKVGDEFTENNIKSIRPCYGLHPKYLKTILGKKSLKDIRKGSRLSWDQIDN